MKLGGPGVGRHPQAGPNNEEQLLSQIQYMYNRRMEQEKEQQATEAQANSWPPPHQSRKFMGLDPFFIP